MSDRQTRELTGYCRELAAGAGAILKRGFSLSKTIDYKGRIDPVTEFDRKAERYLVSRIERRYPDHEVLAEEGTQTGQRSSWRWVIDPLDGTVNFMHGFPIYCVSIAVERDGVIVAGAVFDPERNEMFSAGLGQGAHINKRKLQVSRERRLERALLATGFAYDIGTAKRNNLGLFARMAKKAQGIRRPGSAALDLCWLAAGRIDGFWELKLHPWDTAAAALAVTEAGGRVSRIDGRPYSIYDKDLLASNGRLHSAMAAVLSG
ncbi:MAG: inositol monophosphatase family protein [candidate division Zixibacteria bacterium]|jgi:myo-inositol-1(or 4)-monophosphatase|nr:inositol monophosphatase family protein [candidate division Zixibacteria bacterium]